MSDDLLAYYNDELAFLREMGAEFAEKYPKVAARLFLEAGKCADPHVERILEGAAFLAARIRHKIDDEVPEITDALLGVLYPHYLRPLPSLSIVQFVLGAQQAPPPQGLAIPRGSRLGARPVGGTRCQFRTTYPVSLWPIEVESARLEPDRVVVAGKPPEAVALLRLGLRTTAGAALSELQVDRLRFYLDGDGPVVYALYEMLVNDSVQVWIRGRAEGGRVETVVLPKQAIRPVGFDRDEALFPYPNRSFSGYRLLQEYFAFPEKFLFVDFVGLGAMSGRGFEDSAELLIFLGRPPRADLMVQPENFRLGCTPIVNLFTQVSEPIPLSQTKSEYRVVPDVHRPMATEVYSIDAVVSTSAYLEEPVRYEPFYAHRHSHEGASQQTYWYATRRPSHKKDDPGTDVYLSFVDRGFDPARPAAETVTIHATCTNRDLPARLPFGGEQGDFELEEQAAVGRARCLRKPTAPLRPPLRRRAQWRLISHLSLNHLSLVDSEEGLEALRDLLQIYDFADSSVTRQQIAGITRVASRRVAGRVGRKVGNAVCLGMEVAVEFDESNYVGSGVLPLAGVLERFFGLYTSINSFTQMVATTRQREGILKRWPPRAGERTLL